MPRCAPVYAYYTPKGLDFNTAHIKVLKPADNTNIDTLQRYKMKKFNIDFSFTHISEIVERIKIFINRNKCAEFEADISLLNLVDASKTAILCSTYHFAKYPDGRILWDLRDEQTVRLIMPVKLRNMELRVKEETPVFTKLRA